MLNQITKFNKLKAYLEKIGVPVEVYYLERCIPNTEAYGEYYYPDLYNPLGKITTTFKYSTLIHEATHTVQTLYSGKNRPKPLGFDTQYLTPYVEEAQRRKYLLEEMAIEVEAITVSKSIWHQKKILNFLKKAVEKDCFDFRIFES